MSVYFFVCTNIDFQIFWKTTSIRDTKIEHNPNVIKLAVNFI